MDKEKAPTSRWHKKREKKKIGKLVKDVVMEEEVQEHKYHPVTPGYYIARTDEERSYEREMVLYEMRNHVF